ncbi:restriction endonuclease [Streptomyces sp. NPDC047453]|uniref:restriction endonuclease n=1 Tax=Streptomyces sp. NPDC047453 TaxID=3154812 RepID=UPI0033FEBE98
MLDVLHRDQVALRIHDGAFSAMDLTARHPRTGELLSTVKFMVQTLAAAGELQRDLQRELTYDGLRAAEAKGGKGGRRPAVPAAKTDTVRTAYLEGGLSARAVARQLGISRNTVGADVAVIVTNGRVTAPAVAFAEQQRLHVVDRQTLGRWAAGSRPLWELLRAVPPPRRPTTLN